ncbi:MAG: hypothetical protein ACRD2B_08045 [Terriglobia bacterium]
MDGSPTPKSVSVDVSAALRAICSTGKGRCWYCDVRLPEESRALDDGWDVQRIDDHPVGSIILVCPGCLRELLQVQPAYVPRPVV